MAITSLSKACDLSCLRQDLDYSFPSDELESLVGMNECVIEGEEHTFPIVNSVGIYEGYFYIYAINEDRFLISFQSV